MPNAKSQKPQNTQSAVAPTTNHQKQNEMQNQTNLAQHAQNTQSAVVASTTNHQNTKHKMQNQTNLACCASTNPFHELSPASVAKSTQSPSGSESESVATASASSLSSSSELESESLARSSIGRAVGKVSLSLVFFCACAKYVM